jgi:hypothetical protein
VSCQGETNSQIRFSATGFAAVEQLIGFAEEGLCLRPGIWNPSHGRGALDGKVDCFSPVFLWELSQSGNEFVVSDAHLPSLCKNLRPVSWKISRAVSSCIRVLDNGSCAV